MNRRRVLFVDDDMGILASLQNLLRKQRRVWDIVVAPGGVEALAEMEAAPFDVVVTDMRMPGMDGAELLERVKERHPQTARIVLSGQADQEAVIRSFAVAHQFLSKPCEADVLSGVIERVCNLQAILHDETLRKAVGRVGTLPSAPKAYWALTKAVAQPEVGTAILAEIVEEDPAMCAKVLQLVNSAGFGLAQRITTIQPAVAYLGVELLKGLVLTARIFTLMEHKPVRGFSLERLQQHSVLTARLARRLLGDSPSAEDAFTAGILHDVGEVVLALGFPDRFARVVQSDRLGSRSVSGREELIFGVSHAEVGAYLLGVWGLPFSIVEAIAHHHRPSHVTTGDRNVLAALHVADVLLDAQSAALEDADLFALDIGFLDAAGWTIDLTQWRTLVDEIRVRHSVARL